MGKQVEFFMTSLDEQELFAFARKMCQCSLLLLRSTAPVGSDFILSDQPVGSEVGDDLICVSCEGFGLDFDSVTNASTTVLNVMRSEVVQLRRSTWISGESTLTHGRLWFEQGSSGEKSARFTRWAGSLLSYVRRVSVRQINGRYVARDASAKEARGELFLGRKVTPLSAEEARKKLGLS